METLSSNQPDKQNNKSNENSNIKKVFQQVSNTGQEKLGGKPNIPRPTKKITPNVPPPAKQKIKDVAYKEENDDSTDKVTAEKTIKKSDKAVSHKNNAPKNVVIPDYLEVFMTWDNVDLNIYQELYNYSTFLDHYNVILPDVKIKLSVLIYKWLVINEYYRYVHDGFSKDFQKFLPPVVKSFIHPIKSESVDALIQFMKTPLIDMIKDYKYDDYIYILSMDKTMTLESNKELKDAFLNYVINNSNYYSDLKFIPNVSRNLLDIILGGRCGFYPEPLPQPTYKFLTKIAQNDGYPTLLGLNNVCDCIKAFNDIKKTKLLVECREQLAQIHEVYLNNSSDSSVLKIIESLANELSKLIKYTQNMEELNTYEEAKIICSKPYMCNTTEQTLLMLRYKINSYIRMCTDHINQIDNLLQKKHNVNLELEDKKTYLESNFPWVR